MVQSNNYQGVQTVRYLRYKGNTNINMSIRNFCPAYKLLFDK